jgi:hypothetical protein
MNLPLIISQSPADEINGLQFEVPPAVRRRARATAAAGAPPPPRSISLSYPSLWSTMSKKDS